ncbi:MAG: hypothetical protein HFJ53_05370 [Clostridia bacterium]|jgi:hypothetical protein|nr:hypothetical protein [Clostridia bacterium]
MIIRNSNLRRYLSKNSFKILGIIIGVILLIFIIQTLNGKIANNRKNIHTEENIINSIYKPEQTMVMGEDISKKLQKDNNNIIDKFIEKCNEKDYEQAYSMLSNSCKERLYPTIEYFKNNYIDKVFTQKRIYNLESWISTNNRYTYKIKILDDIIQTGARDNGNVVEDYITIENKNNKYELNINSYIAREEVNKEKEEQGIIFTIKNRDLYKDYTVYNINIKNLTDKDILVDSRQDTDSVYILGENEGKYRAFMYENVESGLVVTAGGFSKNISIRINKVYNPKIQDKSLEFTDIINDYNSYKILKDKSEYKDRTNISIQI